MTKEEEEANPVLDTSSIDYAAHTPGRLWKLWLG